MDIKNAKVRTETLRMMDGEVEVKKMYSIYIKVGEEEIKIASGISTVEKLETAATKK